jgi:hypothetical protein
MKKATDGLLVTPQGATCCGLAGTGGLQRIKDAMSKRRNE